MDDGARKLNALVFDLFQAAWRLDSKLERYGTSSTKVAMNKKKILLMVSDTRDAWNAVLLQVAILLAERSANSATSANTHVAKLALATGTPDWNGISSQTSLNYLEMSLNDAGLIYLQGDKFLFGFGHAQSYELAYKRYHTAAEAGLAEASNMLGLMHENGLGRTKDSNAALYWYRMADGKNNLDASNNLYAHNSYQP
jgi:TPR repeat protein